MSTRVLIIDSNIPFMVSLKQALEGTNAFEVSPSANAVAAQEALRSSEFDVAVIDLSLSETDVASLIEHIRQSKPAMRLMLSYSTDEQARYAERLRPDGIISKPYLARDLIARLGEVQSRRTRVPPPPAEPDADDLHHMAQTRILRDEPPQPGTKTLSDWHDIDRTGSLRKTDFLEDRPTPAGARADSETVPPFVEEPPRHTGDTPTVFLPEFESLGPFTPDEPPAHDDSTFDEVLDALSQTPLPEAPRSPDDEAFHELVNSLSAPDAPARRSTLEDLLSTPPADTGNPLDYVLDSIRRNPPTAGLDDLDESDLDDTTIGEVIESLGQEFQDVLAILDGKEVDEREYPEPDYSEDLAATPAFGPDEADRLDLDDLAVDEIPDWMRHDAPLEDTRRSPLQFEQFEPPASEEDSKHYPATAALSAVDDEDPEFSLADLLNQIEQQLPPPREQRPRLRPLPSWEENASPEEAERLRALFPPEDEWESGDIEEIFPEPAVAAPVEEAPAPLPSEPLEVEWDTFSDEEPVEEALPADFDQFLTQADESEPVERDEADRVALELDLDDDLIEAVQRAAAVDAYADEPPLEEEDTLATEISEAFYEGVRQTAYELQEASAPEHTAIAVDSDWETGPDDESLRRYSGPRSTLLPNEDDSLLEPQHAEVMPNSEPEPPSAGADEDGAELAQIALELTQYSLESSAQATMLTRGGELIAQAGSLPGSAFDKLRQVIETAWSTSPPDYNSLSRFVTLPGVGEFLLFSTIVANGMVLSMAFSANTPVRVIRRQARRLSESLELVPEPAEAPEPEASTTHASRPTDLRAPEGLRPAPPAAEQPAPAPRRPDTPYTGYTVLWLPWDPRLELGGSYAQALAGWIEDIAEERAWVIDELTIESDYVRLVIQVPQKSLPDDVLHTLFDETARLTQEHFPELIDGAGRLWANGYYVVTPPRELSEREIGRFITYQRQAQMS